MKDLAQKLAANPVKSLSFSYRTLRLVEPDQLTEAQVGYARSADGDSLTAGDTHDPDAWIASWVVIGHEELCGDPIFIDKSNSDLPVYTAAHGEGSWHAELIAESWPQFCKVLRYLKPLTVGRENPVAFETNPLENVSQVLEKIGDLTACPDASFWAEWFGDNDWFD